MSKLADYTPDQLLALTKRNGVGKTADALGVSRRAVYDLIKRASGYKSHRLSDDTKASIWIMTNKLKMTPRVICALLGVEPHNIKYHAKGKGAKRAEQLAMARAMVKEARR